MDPRLLSYYRNELQHIRGMGREFAQAYPKIANRLSLDGFECQDPYVERLIESFAYLAARVQLKLDAEFPRFTQHLLETIYPHYLAPVPSMAVVQFEPEALEGVPPNGQTIARGSSLRSKITKGDPTACEYRTAHDTILWPLKLTKAEYLPRGANALSGMKRIEGVRSGLRLTLETPMGVAFNQLDLDNLALYLTGTDEIPMQLYELLVGHTLEVIVRPQGKKPAWENYLGGDCIVQLGFDQDQALLPYDNRSFQGYRLLQEYFAFPKRFLFVEIQGLLESCKQCAGNKIELLLLFDETKNGLEEVVNQSNFSLFATPVVNLFPKTVDRIHLSDQYSEHHVVPDRTRPMDFEIYQITGVQGIGTSQEQKQEFLPFYASRDGVSAHSDKAFYSLNRLPRMLSAKQKRMGPRTEYVGNEVYISLVDAADAPYSHDLKQLAITALCTNRDLPYHISIGQGTTDFYLDSGEDVKSVRVLSGPTKPRPSPAYNDGETAWRLINHLSLNYLSISDAGDEEGAVALRELLKLYSDADDVPSQNQIEGVRSIHSSSITRRLPTPGPIVFGRGIDIAVELDELSFEGMGVFLLGAVLERFFSGYASINTFTETRIKTTKRGEIIRWPARIGSRQRL